MMRSLIRPSAALATGMLALLAAPAASAAEAIPLGGLTLKPANPPGVSATDEPMYTVSYSKRAYGCG